MSLLPIPRCWCSSWTTRERISARSSQQMCMAQVPMIPSWSSSTIYIVIPQVIIEFAQGTGEHLPLFGGRLDQLLNFPDVGDFGFANGHFRYHLVKIEEFSESELQNPRIESREYFGRF